MSSVRPVLPFRHANPHIKQLDSAPLPPVKYQILNCQGQDILVGRMKILTPTPSGHAFILRRFDTGAISLTTMFRAAFPSATDAEEKRETTWVKENYDLTGNNGSSKDMHIIRLAGTWVSPEVALELGAEYSLGSIIPAVARASPDPNANYRRSAKSANNTPKATASTIAVVAPPSAPRTLLTPAPSLGLPNPPKRRRESSPVVPAAEPVSVPPRRSARTKSPAPKAGFSIPRTPKSPKVPARREEVLTPAGSDETAVEDDPEAAAAGNVASAELAEQDIAEQRDLIADLKAKRDAAMREEEEPQEDDGDTTKLKRVREDEEQTLTFDFKEPEVGERAIATNSRVSNSRFNLEPRTKSVAWGVAAFAFGLGAVAFLPNFL